MIMKKISITLICLLLSLFLIGCPHPGIVRVDPEKDLVASSNSISKNTEVISLSTDKIEQNNQSIKKSANQVEKDLPAEHAPVITPNLQTIKDSSTEIQISAERIKTATNELKATGVVVKKTSDIVANITAEMERLKKERDEAIAAKDAAIHKTLKWVIVGCIFAIAGFSVVFFIYGQKLGLLGAGTAAVVLGISAFVDMYFAYLAIIGGILAMGVLIALVWQIIKRYKALKEVVNTVEVVKDNLSVDVRDKIFGDEDKDGIVDIVQSKATTDLVKSIKQSFPSLWKYVKKYKQNGEDDIS